MDAQQLGQRRQTCGSHRNGSDPPRRLRRRPSYARAVSAAGDEGDHDVGSVAIEVLPAPVVDRRYSRVCVPGGQLHIPQRHAGVEGRHDERGPKHVRVHRAEAGPLADGPNPAVRGPTVEPFAVTAAEDRAFAPFADGQVDGSCRPRDERNGGGLVALADDVQRAMAASDAEVLDVGGARLAHSQSVQPEEHRQGGMGAVVTLGGEQEHAELGAVESSPRRRVHCGRRTYCAGFEAMRPSICAKR